MTSHEQLTVPLKFSLASLSDFYQRFQFALENPKCKVLILVGNDDYYSIGMDLDYIVRRVDDDFIGLVASVLTLVRTSSKPVIAKVAKGVIAGGLVFPALSDFVVSASSATYQLPEASFDLTPSIAMVSLAERMTARDIKRMVWSCETLTAEKAFGCGLVDDVTEPGHLDARTEQWARRFARLSPSVVEDSRRLLSSRPQFSDRLEAGCKLLDAAMKRETQMDKVSQYLQAVGLFNDEYTT